MSELNYGKILTINPCPWCGKTPKINYISGQPMNSQIQGFSFMLNGRYDIRCGNVRCGFSFRGQNPSFDETVLEWNAHTAVEKKGTI